MYRSNTKLMKIEIKKIQFGAEGSHQETLNFACDVFINGIKAVSAHNSGHGGSTHLTCYAGQHDLLAEAFKWAKAQPDVELGAEYGGGTLPNSLESMVDTLVDDIYNEKHLAKVTSKEKAKLMKKTSNCIIIADLKKLEGYRYIKLKWDINEHIVEKKNPKAIECILTVLREKIPTIAKGEEIINTNIAHLVAQVKAELKLA